MDPDPDPEGPKTCGSGSATLVRKGWIRIRIHSFWILILFFFSEHYHLSKIMFFQMPATFWLATATGTGSMWPYSATTAPSSGSSSVPPLRYRTQLSEKIFPVLRIRIHMFLGRYLRSRVQRIFFIKLTTHPLMGAKFESKTHLVLNTFFYFWWRFLLVWLPSLKKVLIIWPENFFLKI